MWTWLTSAFVNPALLGGAALVSVPIIIHILSRRRFRIVDWAAMDLLLDADRRNRRRVRLEHLILLLLRCAAVLWAALLVARPLVRPAGAWGGILARQRFERIVLLDDSPSMGARVGIKTAFDGARAAVVDLVRQAARRHPGDTLTLLLTSQPDRPLMVGQYLAGGRAEQAVRLVQGLEPTDRSAQLDRALAAVLERVQEREGGAANRIVYLVGDLRHVDWLAAATGPAEEDRAVPQLAAEVARAAQGMAIVDVGAEVHGNLTVAQVRARPHPLCRGVPARCEVTVRNGGPTDARDVDVTLFAGESPLGSVRLGSVPAGGEAVASLTFVFHEPGWTALRAEIPGDPLPADNAHYAALRALEAVRVLLVDGDPAAEAWRSETYLLEHALAPPGEVPSGNRVAVVPEGRLDGAALDAADVVVLCNVYRLSEEQVAALEAWVRAGGGLIVFLGGQVDETFYNEHLHRRGLLPARLGEVRGDDTERTWVALATEQMTHPLLRPFAGARTSLLDRVKVFRWWTSAPDPADLLAGRAAVVVHLTDPDRSAAIVEGTLGEGRALMVSVTADEEWSTWPAEPSYIVAALEMVRYVLPRRDGENVLPVGAPLHVSLDPTRCRPEALLTLPPGHDAPRAIALQAAPQDDGRLGFVYARTDRKGFYAVDLRTHEGGEERVLFGVNIDPTEGDLRRADAETLRKAFAGAPVRFMRPTDDLLDAGAGATRELWRALLFALAATLAVEQFLGWFFGRKR